ncbi:MAG: type II secretion system protein, partial [Pseudomonadales bacterium]|nr:type II secretion system protein [Pseudomonadales bacterium]
EHTERQAFAPGTQHYAAGFTLIELVAVIVLISILAAIAAPRFFNLKDDAEAAALQALAGSFSTGVAIGKAQWITNGNSPNSVSAVDQRVVIDGIGFNVNRYGWQDSATEKDSQDLTVTGQTATDCQEVFEYILQSPPRNTIERDLASRRKAQYAVSVVEGSNSDRCRYELVVRAAQDPETAEFYFDYEMLTGRVTVNLPEGL